MRDIKFRAWDNINKKMIFGPTDDKPNSSWILALPEAENIFIMQYTTRKDKNGTEIYANSIIEWPCGNDFKLKGVVVWYFDQWRISIMPCACCGSYTCDNYSQVPHAINQRDWGRCEEIGNIHENLKILSQSG